MNARRRYKAKARRRFARRLAEKDQQATQLQRLIRKGYIQLLPAWHRAVFAAEMLRMSGGRPPARTYGELTRSTQAWDWRASFNRLTFKV